MPRSGWLAIGGLATSLAWPSAGPAGVVAIVGLTLALLGELTRRASAGVGAAASLHRRRRAIAALALLAGELALAFRLLAAGGGGQAAPAALPAGSGPWEANVEAVGAPLGGQQRATLRLDPPASRLAVAATLPPYPLLAPGDRVQFRGALRPPPEGDYGAYLQRNGVAAVVLAPTLELLPGKAGPGRVIEGIRRTADAALARALPEPLAGLAAGILLGLRERVDRDLAAAFTTAGVSHVVAISGWNIAIVAAMVAALLGRRSRRTRAIATVAAVAAYTVLVGASPSVLRAALMAGIVLAARESGRATRAAAALGWAATLMLVADPGVALDAGFQLSTVATAGLVAWSAPLTRRLRAGPAARLPAALTETLGVSLAAQAATLPVILLDFGRLSLVAPAANLVVVPLVPAAMAGGTLALGAGLLGTCLPAGLANGTAGSLAIGLLAFPGWACLGLLVTLVRIAAGLPLASVTLDPPLDLAGALLATTALALVTAPGRALLARLRPAHPAGHGRRPASASAAVSASNGNRRPAGSPRTGGDRGRSVTGRLLATAAVLAALALLLAGASRPDGRIRLTVLDVGQGDAILVEGGRGTRLLVDGGPDPGRLLGALDPRLPPWDRRIDLLVLTHPHEDHVGGLPALLERYRVGRVFEPGMRGAGPAYAAWEGALRSRGLSSEHLAAGDRLSVDGLILRVLWPIGGRVPAEPGDDGRSVNDVSIVLLGEWGDQRFLLTGDAEDDVDPELLAAGLPHLDLLKVAHHGSATSTGAALLAATRPSVAIVSVGTPNRYGHPSPATLARLEDAGGRVFRTDRDGTVAASLDGDRLDVRGSLADPAGVSALAGESAPSPGPGAVGTVSLYHRADEHPRARRGRRPPPRPRSTPLAPASLARGRRDRRLAGRSRRAAGCPARSPPGRGGGAPARCRQGAAGRRTGAPAGPRRGLRRMARGPGPRRARPARRRSPGHAPRR